LPAGWRRAEPHKKQKCRPGPCLGRRFYKKIFPYGGKAEVVRSGVEYTVEGKNLNTHCHQNGGAIDCVTHFIAPFARQYCGKARLGV